MVKKTLPKKIDKAIDEYLEILKKDKLSIRKAYLFGSYAKGKARWGSDIDICIVSPKFKNFSGAIDYLWEKRIVNKDVHIEPIGFHPKDFVNGDPLAYEIKRTGIEIKV